MEKRDIRECKVSANRKLKEIELLEKPVEFLDGHFYAKADVPEEAISISDISFMDIQFQVPGEEKDSLIIPIPMVLNAILSDMTGTIANQMLDTIINAAAGEQAETISKYLDDEEPANEEDDDSICIWNNFSAGINTIAGILVGNLSQYIAEKYGKGMSTDNISEFVHNLSNVILEIM